MPRRRGGSRWRVCPTERGGLIRDFCGYIFPGPGSFRPPKSLSAPDGPEDRRHFTVRSSTGGMHAPLSLPVRGIPWGWIARSPLGGSGFLLSRSMISGIVSFEWGTSFVTVTPPPTVPFAVSAGAPFPPVWRVRLQQPGATDRRSSRPRTETGRRVERIRLTLRLRGEISDTEGHVEIAGVVVAALQGGGADDHRQGSRRQPLQRLDGLEVRQVLHPDVERLLPEHLAVARSARFDVQRRLRDSRLLEGGGDPRQGGILDVGGGPDDSRLRGGFTLDPLDLGARKADLGEVALGGGRRPRLRLDPRDARNHDERQQQEGGRHGPADHEDALFAVTKHGGPLSSRRGW